MAIREVQTSVWTVGEVVTSALLQEHIESDADDPVVCSCPNPDVTAVGMCLACGRKPVVLLGRFPARAGRLSEVTP